MREIKLYLCFLVFSFVNSSLLHLISNEYDQSGSSTGTVWKTLNVDTFELKEIQPNNAMPTSINAERSFFQSPLLIAPDQTEVHLLDVSDKSVKSKSFENYVNDLDSATWVSPFGISTDGMLLGFGLTTNFSERTICAAKSKSFHKIDLNTGKVIRSIPFDLPKTYNSKIQIGTPLNIPGSDITILVFGGFDKSYYICFIDPLYGVMEDLITLSYPTLLEDNTGTWIEGFDSSFGEKGTLFIHNHETTTDTISRILLVDIATRKQKFLSHSIGPEYFIHGRLSIDTCSRRIAGVVRNLENYYFGIWNYELDTFASGPLHNFSTPFDSFGVAAFESYC